MKLCALLLLAVLAAASAAAGPAAAMGPDDEAPADPAAPSDPVRRAIALAEAGRTDEALSIARSLQEDRPNDPDVLSALGFATRKAGLLDESELWYSEALARDPAHRGALEYLGELYLQTGRRDLALEVLRRLERACPDGCEERAELTTLLHP